MNESSLQYALVLIGRYPGKDMAVAQALARSMGRDEAWGLRIVSSSPIVVFDKLSQKQATHLATGLAEVSNAGCRFEVQTGSVASLPKVGWANPPRINGRLISEIAPGVDMPTRAQLPTSRPTPTAPTTQAAPKLNPTPPVVPQAVLAAANSLVDGSTHATTTLLIPCPYTGQKIKLTLSVSLSRDNGVNFSASAAPAGQSVPRSVNAVSGTIIPPSAAQLRQSGPNISMRASGPNMRPTASHPPETGRGEHRSRMATGAFATNTGDLPPDTWRLGTPDDVLLPDVPVLPTASKSKDYHDEEPDVQPLPLNSSAMDMSTFEANLGVDSNDAMRPFLDSESGVFNDLLLPGTEGVSDSEEDGEILCSVFIERSSSPVVHELVAELHGIPESEASEMCVSGSVALAENIPLFEAKDIKRRCGEINVFARIVRQD